MDRPNPQPFVFLTQTPFQERSPYVPEVVVPARVNKALEFLGMCAFKQMTRGIANDISIEQIKGQELTVEEATAHATACNLLAKYFAGKLPLDDFEKLKVKGVNKAISQKDKGTLVGCPSCNGRQGAHNCVLCKGSGQVIITPVNPEDLDE